MMLRALPLIFLCFAQLANATITLRWERIPLSVRLFVGQERVILLDRDVRVGVPAETAPHLQVVSAGRTLYIKAAAPIAPTRLQLEDMGTGSLILLDVAADVATAGEPPLEPVRLVTEPSAGDEDGSKDSKVNIEDPGAPAVVTPIPVVLTRYAAQSLYAPLRTIEPQPAIVAVAVNRSAQLTSLLPAQSLRATALAGWRLKDYWVTAVKLTNLGRERITLDPRHLRGDYAAATFQHGYLEQAGSPSDTTVVYLVTRGQGLQESLVPAASPFVRGRQ